MLKRHRAIVLGLALLLGVAVAAGAVAAQLVKLPAVAAAAPATHETATPLGALTLEGTTFVPDTAKTNILFLGIDQELTSEESDVAGTAGRSDVILLFSLDHAANTTCVLQISRDTIVPVKVYDANDRYLYLSQMQITMQHAYASSARRANWLSEEAVRDLLGGDIIINYTVSLSMEGIAAVVDAMGGVPYTVPANCTDLDPAFTEGTALTLTGEQAMTLVRSRDTALSGSNHDRMERQQSFIHAALRQAKALEHDTFLDIVQNTAAPYLESDLDADTLSRLINSQLNENFVVLAGNNQVLDGHDAYHLDETAAQKQIVELLYKIYE